MISLLKKYDKTLRLVTMIKWMVTQWKLIRNFFFPSMVVACEILKGSEMVQANPTLKLAGISRFKIEMAFSERKDNGLAPPVMKIKVPPKYLSVAQDLF
jgi:hypothetical protein